MSLNYSRAGGTVEIIIRDNVGSKIETHKFNLDDRQKGDKILHYIKKKYGFYPEFIRPLEPEEPKKEEFWSNGI